MNKVYKYFLIVIVSFSVWVLCVIALMLIFAEHK